MNNHSATLEINMPPMVSPYLLRPIRTREEAIADLKRNRSPSNVHSFVKVVSTGSLSSGRRASAA